MLYLLILKNLIKTTLEFGKLSNEAHIFRMYISSYKNQPILSHLFSRMTMKPTTFNWIKLIIITILYSTHIHSFHSALCITFLKLQYKIVNILQIKITIK